MKEVLAKVKGDESGTIDSLISFLQEQKENGATHYKMTSLYHPNQRRLYFHALPSLKDCFLPNSNRYFY